MPYFAESHNAEEATCKSALYTNLQHQIYAKLSMYQSNLKDYFNTLFLIKLTHFSNYFDTLIKLIQSHCFYRHFLPTKFYFYRHFYSSKNPYIIYYIIQFLKFTIPTL